MLLIFPNPWVVRFEPKSGAILDAKNGNPVVGADVTVTWYLSSGLLYERVVGTIGKEKVKTDLQGEFTARLDKAWYPFLAGGGTSNTPSIIVEAKG